MPIGVTLEWTVEVVGCPTCKVKRGEPCKTPRGRLAPVHAPRYAAAKAHARELQRLEAWHRDVAKEV